MPGTIAAIATVCCTIMTASRDASSQLRCRANSCRSCGAVPIRAAFAVQCPLEGDGDSLVSISIGHSAAGKVSLLYG